MKVDDILSSPFSFTRRAEYIPCDTRASWKCALATLIIGITGKDFTCSLKKIHTANWILKSKTHLKYFDEWTAKNSLFPPGVRMDPSIDRAIELLAASGHLEKSNGKLSLTDGGLVLYNGLSNEGVMLKEKEILISLKRKLSEAAVERIFKAR